MEKQRKCHPERSSRTVFRLRSEGSLLENDEREILTPLQGASLPRPQVLGRSQSLPQDDTLGLSQLRLIIEHLWINISSALGVSSSR
jgi:hypothetical protein